MMNLKTSNGLTMLELLIILAILGILATAGIPSFMDTLGRMSANSAAREMVNTFSLARSEAVKRGLDVSICPSNDGLDCDAGEWSSGWIMFLDANGDATGASGSVDDGDTIIRVFEPLSGMNLSASTNLMQYDRKGFGSNSGVLTFTLCPLDGEVDNARAVIVSLSGRSRIEEGGLSC